MKKTWKQLIAIACTISMIVCLLPIVTLSEEGQDPVVEQPAVTEPAEVLEEEPAAEEPAAPAEEPAAPVEEPAAPVEEPAAPEIGRASCRERVCQYV